MGIEDPTVADGASASMSSSKMADLVGRVLQGRYRATRKVGAGSMGDVYEGVALASGGRIAIKVLKPERAVRDVFRHRFLREAKSAVLIAHPNVVNVIDYGETEDGLLYIAMEFLEGEDLASYIGRVGRRPWRQCLPVLQQVAAALAAAHDRGVVHRDVKPSNILLRADGQGGSIVKLVDFGVAKLDNHLVSRVLTQAADVVGTVMYMSPEQAEGRRADLRSDVYAFGVTAFQLATGTVPFPGRDLFKVMTAHMTAPPPTPSTHATDLPPVADAFILRCLAKSPDDRYQSMHDVLAVLAGEAPPDLVSTPRPGTPLELGDPSPHERHPALAADVDPADSQASAEAEPPTDAAGEFDDEEAPTTYFRSLPVETPAPVPPGAASTPVVPSPPPPLHPPSSSTAPASSPFAAGALLGGRTLRSPITDVGADDLAPLEPRTSPAVYALLVLFLIVLGALVLVVLS